jgi:hypothetical protein
MQYNIKKICLEIGFVVNNIRNKLCMYGGMSHEKKVNKTDFIVSCIIYINF